MVIDKLLLVISIFFVSCNPPKPKAEPVNEIRCDFKPYPFYMPFTYDENIQGKISLFKKDSNFGVLIKEDGFYLSNGATNKIKNITKFYIPNVNYCYDFIIYLNISGNVTIHRFSNFEIETHNYGGMEVFQIKSYVYNNEIFTGQLCDFRLNIPKAGADVRQ